MYYIKNENLNKQVKIKNNYLPIKIEKTEENFLVYYQN